MTISIKLVLIYFHSFIVKDPSRYKWFILFMTHSLDFVEDFNPDSDTNWDRLLYKTLYLYWHLKDEQ